MGTSEPARGEIVPFHPGRLRPAALRLRSTALTIVPLWVLVGIGKPKLRLGLWPMAAALTAAALLVRPVQAALWRRRRRRLEPIASLEPWEYDDDAWKVREQRTTALTASFPYAAPLAAALGIAAYAWFALWATEIWRPEWGIGLALVTFAASMAIRLRGHARSTAIWKRFPYRVGEPVRVRFHFTKVSGAPAVFERLTFTLQALTERPHWAGFLRPEVRRVFAVEVVHGDDLTPSPLDMQVEFDVPADAPGTDLLASPAVFWELAVRGEGASFVYAETFRVPVYARPA